MAKNGKPPRFTVSFDENDMALLLKVQSAEQIRLNKRVSSAEIVRIALRELAAKQNQNSWS